MKPITKGLLFSALLSACSPCDYEQLSKLPDETSVPAEYRDDAMFIKEVRNFGITHLGLYSCTQHYTTFSPTDGEATPLYHVLFTKPLVLPLTSKEYIEKLSTLTLYREDVQAKHLWSFVDDLKDEEKYYHKEGYDVFLRSTTNYNLTNSEEGSAITPSLTKTSRAWEANTVLHEICHDGLEEWIGDFPSELNESFCNVVGMAGAVEFFKHKDVHSPEYAQAVQIFQYYLEHSLKFNQVYDLLRALYANPRLTDEQKQEQRKVLFAEAAPLFNVEVNNAVLWESYPYRKNFPLMMDLYESYNKNIPGMIKDMKECPEDEMEALKFIHSLIIRNSDKIISKATGQ